MTSFDIGKILYLAEAFKFQYSDAEWQPIEQIVRSFMLNDNSIDKFGKDKFEEASNLFLSYLRHCFELSASIYKRNYIVQTSNSIYAAPRTNVLSIKNASERFLAFLKKQKIDTTHVEFAIKISVPNYDIEPDMHDEMLLLNKNIHHSYKSSMARRLFLEHIFLEMSFWNWNAVLSKKRHHSELIDIALLACDPVIDKREWIEGVDSENRITRRRTILFEMSRMKKEGFFLDPDFINMNAKNWDEVLGRGAS